jgi:hypothetical protein
VLKTPHGFKLLILYEVKLRLVVAAKLVKIQDSETLDLVQQVQRNLGPTHPIKVLLADPGFLDGQPLWTLKHDLAIDWVVPVRTTMDIASHARPLATQPPDDVYVTVAMRLATGVKGRGQVTVRGVFDLTTFNTYGDAAHQLTLNHADFKPNPVKALVVTHWRAKPYAQTDQPVFATSLDVSKPLRVLALYDRRSLIENTAFRELKQGWHLPLSPNAPWLPPVPMSSSSSFHWSTLFVRSAAKPSPATVSVASASPTFMAASSWSWTRKPSLLPSFSLKNCSSCSVIRLPLGYLPTRSKSGMAA